MIKDHRGDEGRTPPPVTITRKEHNMIRPGKPGRRIDFVFKHGGALLIDLDLAEFILKKRSTLYAIDRKSGKSTELADDLDKLKYNELLKVLSDYNQAALKYNITPLNMSGKTIKIRQKIRYLKNMGVKLLTPEEKAELNKLEDIKKIGFSEPLQIKYLLEFESRLEAIEKLQESEGKPEQKTDTEETGANAEISETTKPNDAIKTEESGDKKGELKEEGQD